VALLDRYEGTSTAYQTVVEWKVGRVWGKDRGRIIELGLNTDQYAKTKWRVTVANRVLFEDKLTQSSVNFPYYCIVAELGLDEKVTIEAKSTDGTSVKADGMITAIEYD
jgi:hypothetical protein